MQDLKHTLTYFDYPKQHWTAIRTSNYLELQIRHIRARIKSIGCFKNKFSAERYIFGVIQTTGRNLTDIRLSKFTHF